jgi:hypothetical protein
VVRLQANKKAIEQKRSKNTLQLDQVAGASGSFEKGASQILATNAPQMLGLRLPLGLYLPFEPATLFLVGASRNKLDFRLGVLLSLNR